MKSISGKNFCKILERKGWILKRIKGSHHIYQNPQNNRIVSVPVHRNQDLKLGILGVLMKTANISEDELK
ncbi:conserved hypothetical protein [Planktothrix sp. PCC 11201]|uniref:type II toxin-antitoxin system HicA family toxin n=1 Tax=Planktothrix sp. PCC 11201 TaxID=1729650 RepID=UPI000911A4CA|nr:type II toxin-antitoxin system HicA family toxin [Planktothrix sp. PCC 11201]SKB15966.1 conserved hypothetical protein [Planktothrix sp. PCC 11201]